ncbi:MAG TPA: pilus assembly protein N-terminal domain-containing protein, partial [Nitrospiria bacterium]|nr:pilus assembly protein N-terminal domain-containing protein [Nitrospiria bacterium]
MIRRVLRAGFFLFLTFAEVLYPLPAIGETIRLRPGFQHILEYREARRLSIGNPEIIEARPLPLKDGILVVGKKEGNTDLVVWGPG